MPSIIITNHAFLSMNLKRDEPVLPASKGYHCEAHHLPDVSNRGFEWQFFFITIIKKMIKKIGKPNR